MPLVPRGHATATTTGPIGCKFHRTDKSRVVISGLQVNAAKFFIFFLDLFLTTMCAAAIAFVASASVGVFAIANLIVVLILILMMVTALTFLPRCMECRHGLVTRKPSDRLSV